MSPAQRVQRKDHLDEDRLIDLLAGLVPVEQTRAALRHLRDCVDCEEQFRTLAIEWERVKMGDQPGRVGGRLELVRSPVGTTRRPPRIALVAAGTLAAGLLLAALLLPPSSPSSPIAWWLPVDQTYVRLRADSQSLGSADLLVALESYREGRATRAADLLSKAEVSERYAELRDIYLASSLILSGRSPEAEPILERVDVETLPSPWRQMAQWLVYVTLHERGETERADELLERLCTAPGEVGGIARAERERR